MILTHNDYKSGQGALVAVALVVLAGLVVVGLSVSNLGSLNAKRSVAVEYALETYYCALSGRQEAISTRMVPRSNQLALSGLEATANKPFNKQSGYCYLNPNGATSDNVVGLYRYLIVGGDPARDPSTGNWFDINQQPNNTIKQPFYIISQGAICRDNATKAAKINAISYNKTTKDVECGVGQYIDRLTTVTEVDFSRQNGNQDKINNFQVAQDPSSIALKQPAWVPCQNVTQNMNFNTAYGCGTFPALHHIAFYIPGSGGSVTSIQSPFNTNPTVPANGLMRLFFEGPYDYRTAFGPKTSPLSQCLANPAACSIKLMKQGSTTSTQTTKTSGTSSSSGGISATCQGPEPCQVYQSTGMTTIAPFNKFLLSTEVPIISGNVNYAYEGTTSSYAGTSSGSSVSLTGSFVKVKIIPTLAGSTQLVLAPDQPLAGGSYHLIIENLKDYAGNGFSGSITIPFTVAGGGTTPPTGTPPATTTPTCPYPQIWAPCQQQCVYRTRCVCGYMRQEKWDETTCGYIIDENTMFGTAFCDADAGGNSCAQQGSGDPFQGGVGYPF